MEFKEAVKQSSFTSNQAEAALNIIYTANWLEDVIRRALKPYGISHEQYNVLRILRGVHPGAHCLQDIRDRMLNRWSNASRLVEKLRKKGYVTRQPMEENRRMVEIKITDAGLELLDELDACPFRLDEIYTNALGADDARRLSNLLDEMRGKMERALENTDLAGNG